MKTQILLIGVLAFLSGCAGWKGFEPIVAVPSYSSNYILSCLTDTRSLKQEEFNTQFELAKAELEQGRYLDKLRFVCLGLNDKADYKQFAHGKRVLDQYFEDYQDAGDDMKGLQVLVNRLDEEILNRWSAWKSLLNDKKELKEEVQLLNVTIDAQQKQIEQLKNIENIIKSRETDKP